MPAQCAGNFLRIMVLFIEPPPPLRRGFVAQAPPVANHTSMNLRVTGAMGGPPPQCLPIRLLLSQSRDGAQRGRN